MLQYLKTEADTAAEQNFDAEISNVSRRGVLGGISDGDRSRIGGPFRAAGECA